MKEAIVEEEVKTYFTDRFRQFSVSQQCEIQFGTRHGIADVVLHQSIGDEVEKLSECYQHAVWSAGCCEFLERYAKGKFAIYLHKAQVDYDPCGVCNPVR